MNAQVEQFAESITMIHAARWVICDVEKIIDDGAVAVAGERIVAIGAKAEIVAQFPHAVMRDYGEAAILPGFVNAHSHLELTAMRGFLEREEAEFSGWLRKLTVTKYGRMTWDDMRLSATWGAIEAARAGVTCLGDASDYGGASLTALRDVGLRAIVYQELFGIDENVADKQLADLKEKVDALRGNETSLVRVGVSPHAPYTVSGRLLELAADYCLEAELPMMMHAAESQSEVALMRDGTGRFAEGLRKRGVAWHAPGASTIAYLTACGILSAKPLLAHCINVSAADLELVKEHGASIAHCPKSNLKLGHGRAPFTIMLEKNLAVGLGSDSVASNNTCDMLEEGRFAALLARLGADRNDDPATREHEVMNDVDARVVLDAAARGGARALRLEREVGTLAVGMQADIAVVRLGGAHQTPVHDVHAALVFTSSASDVVATIVAGREVYRDGRVGTVDEERLRAQLGELKERMT